MNRNLLPRFEDLLSLFEEAHQEVAVNFKNGNCSSANSLLAECQASAVEMGMGIEMSEGENFITVHLLEEYCELLYQAGEEIGSGLTGDFPASIGHMDEQIQKIRKSLRRDAIIRKEAVFLPYKPAMWDSLESVWRKYADDPAYDTYVVPIPYYEKNSDGSLGTLHYEGNQYPKDVPVVDYKTFDIAARHPDVIYIHNPYDGTNRLTAVPQEYYAKNLRYHTDKLVYIPYFVLGEPDPENEAVLDGLGKFILLPGVMYAHQTIVQSENMRRAYIEVMTRAVGEDSRMLWEQRICGDGSPKLEHVRNTKKEDVDIPKEWERFLYREDGSLKKVILYNISVIPIQERKQEVVDKMRRVFAIFRENQKDVTLLLRPHPLLETVISKELPELLGEYHKVIEEYKNGAYGIYDDTPDLGRAIALADAYYGDQSSLVHLCQEAKMPVMIQNYEI